MSSAEAASMGGSKAIAPANDETTGPTTAPPRHLCGFGLYLYGDRDYDKETQSFVRTLCLCVMYIPILALRSYRVAPADNGWRQLGRVPVSAPARVLSLVTLIALVGGGGLFGAVAYLYSPSQIAQRRLTAADRLIAQGKIGDSAGLLAEVALGPIEQSNPGVQRLVKLVDDPASRTDLPGLAVAIREAAKVQKAGRWPGSPDSLSKNGVELAKQLASSDPKGAWALLDVISTIGPPDPTTVSTREELLEKVVAADPSDPEWASRLGLLYESKGQIERCEKILSPLRSRLGEFEGARLLALVDARANRLEQALPLLRTYSTARLRRLGEADAKLQALYRAAQERILAKLKSERVYDFNYDGYQTANQDQRQGILVQYIESKVKDDVEIAKAREAVMAEAGVTPAALELGLILIQHASAQRDLVSRKALLDEAEATFLAVKRVAGDRDDYQCSLAEVYYWQGKHAEGRKLLDDVLKARNREPGLLLHVANLLRTVGSDSEARVLAEEGYEKAPPGPLKSNCAVARGLLGNDVQDRILWLRRANANEPNIKAILHEDLASEALDKGNELEAIQNLRQAVSIYESMPESGSVLNNGYIALSRLADLTADPAARDRATAMIEKAAALQPGHSLTLYNASGAIFATSLSEVIGTSIDLGVLKSSPSFELLDFLVKDATERQALSARLRANSGLKRALLMMDKVLLLGPRNPNFYAAPKGIYAYCRDDQALRAIRARLERTELDLNDQAKSAQESYSGGKDNEAKGAVQGLLTRLEPMLPVARAKGGPTFAVAVSRILQARVSAAMYGNPSDSDAWVALAEEAFAAAPSLASRHTLHQVLMFRGLGRVAKADAKFADLRDRTFRSISSDELLGVMLSNDGPHKELAMNDPDVGRAIELLHESYMACPSYATGPRLWSLLRHKFPDAANAVAKAYTEEETIRLEDEIDAKLRPYDPTATLISYWKALMANNEREAIEIVKEAKARGVPVPIETP
jgi:hypothetical protein